MYYRSFADLSALVGSSIKQLPADLDLVVGIPRSGLLVANLIALHMHLPLTDVGGLLENRLLGSGRRLSSADFQARTARKVLVVDDSVLSGTQLARVKEQLRGIQAEITYAAAYVAPRMDCLVDIAFEILPEPRIFEWNLLHSWVVTQSCMDIDGVLCRDPLPEENDDGERYRRFLREVAIRFRPRVKVAHLVTNRLEKYRAETEQWLATHGIQYGQLWMQPYATQAERRAANAYGRLKAEVYRKTDTRLFIESCRNQARDIAELAQKPVFCTDTRRMHYPGQPDTAIMTFAGPSPGIVHASKWYFHYATLAVRRRLHQTFNRVDPRYPGRGVLKRV